MNILADESVSKQVVERLRKEGYAVLYIAEMEPSITDDVVLLRANEQNALLITADKDFGELVFHQKSLSSGGIVLLRLAGLSNELKAETVTDAFARHTDDFINSFSVISPGSIRIRPNP
jgi:predicted nuclease of predicted toxin-antitoxin system